MADTVAAIRRNRRRICYSGNQRLAARSLRLLGWQGNRGCKVFHLWRTADVNGTWAKAKSGDANYANGHPVQVLANHTQPTELAPFRNRANFTRNQRRRLCRVDKAADSRQNRAAILSGFIGSYDWQLCTASCSWAFQPQPKTL